MLLGTYRGNVYPKRRFWVHVGMAGADGFEPPVTESESAALPLGEAPYQKGPSLVRCTMCLKRRRALSNLAGVDGVKPPSADLESAVLLTELNS